MTTALNQTTKYCVIENGIVVASADNLNAALKLHRERPDARLFAQLVGTATERDAWLNEPDDFHGDSEAA